MIASWIAALIEFQSTPLREGRQDPVRLEVKAYMFQSTPLREGRLDQ